MIHVESINELLKKTWEIIGGNYSFILPNFVENQTDDNIMVTFLKIRIATEGICRYVVVYEGLIKESNIKDPTLNKYIEWLNRSFEIPSKIRHIYLPNIQALCNGMAHYKDAPLSFSDAMNCAEMFALLLKWFVDNYGGTRINDFSDILLSQNMKGSIPEKVDGIFLSREKDSKYLNEILDTRGYISIVSGPGTGKTELCKDYVERYAKKYDRVYYIENPVSITQFVYDLPFRVVGANNLRKEKLLEKKVECLQDLNIVDGSGKKKYLFILDNYEGNDEGDIAFLQTILSNMGGNVHLIITSTEKFGLMEYMVPSLFELEEYYSLFRFYNPKVYEDGAIKSLSLALKGNLRAIKMVACYLNNHSEEVNIEDFLLQVQQNMNELNSAELYNQLCIALLEDDNEMDAVKKKILTLATFIPSIGIDKKEFIDLLFVALRKEASREKITDIINALAYDTWISIVNKTFIDEEEHSEWIEMSPIISETLFVRMRPNWEEEHIIIYLDEIVKNIENASKFTEARIEELKPLVNHISRRLLNGQTKNYAILSTLRDYYIASYDTKNIEILSERISLLLEEYNKTQKSGDIQQAFYREGIANLNVEEFEKAAILLEKNIRQNEQRIIELKSKIAVASAHCAHALARSGKSKEALDAGKRSILIREELIDAGNIGVKGSLWISYYNYALAHFYANQNMLALENCEKSMELFPEVATTDAYYVNYSSPLHLRGQIYLEMSCVDEIYLDKAIEDLELAREIRIKGKGNNTFWVAQLEIYLSDAYERMGDLMRNKGDITARNEYEKAESYANSALGVKLKQHKTENMIRQINELEHVRTRLKQKMGE